MSSGIRHTRSVAAHTDGSLRFTPCGYVGELPPLSVETGTLGILPACTAALSASVHALGSALTSGVDWG